MFKDSIISSCILAFSFFISFLVKSFMLLASTTAYSNGGLGFCFRGNISTLSCDSILFSSSYLYYTHYDVTFSISIFLIQNAVLITFFSKMRVLLEVFFSSSVLGMSSSLNFLQYFILQYSFMLVLLFLNLCLFGSDCLGVYLLVECWSL